MNLGFFLEPFLIWIIVANFTLWSATYIIYICKKLHQFEISILESSYFGLRLVKFIPDFIFILQLDYWCLFYVYTEKAVGSHIKSLRHKKARPPTKTGFQSREITALNAPPPQGAQAQFPLCGLGRKGAALSMLVLRNKMIFYFKCSLITWTNMINIYQFFFGSSYKMVYFHWCSIQ